MGHLRLRRLVVGGVVVVVALIVASAHPVSAKTGNEKSDKSDKPDKPEKIERVEQADRVERTDKSEKMKQRLEQLFIWRVSDRLQLNPTEETKFTETFRKLSEERMKLSQQLESTLDQIDREKDNTEKTAKLLSDYSSTLKRYNQSQTKEIDVMSKLFNQKKMIQYVLLKREMTHKFRDVLSSQNQVAGTKPAEKTNLKEPEVIEQK